MNARPQPRFLLAAALLGIALTGCVTTQLDVDQVSKIADGQVYYLPRAEFGIEVEREVTRCEVRPVLRHVASLWIREQVNALGSIQKALDELILAKRSLYCDADRAQVDKKLGADLAKQLREHPFANGNCGSKTVDDLKSEADQALAFLVGSFINDPRIEMSGAASILREADFVASDDVRTTIDGLQKAAQRITQPDPIETTVGLDVEVRAKIEPYYLADMGHAYTIDYSGTRRSLKKTEYEVKTYDNGTLRSVNVQLEDRTGEVIRSTLSGVLKLASAASGISFPAPAAAGAQKAAQVQLVSFERFEKLQQRKVQQLCTQRVLDLLAERAVLEKTLGTLPAVIRQKAAALEAATTAAAEAEKALAGAKAAGKTGDELKPFETAVTEKKAAQTAARTDLEAKQKLAQPAASQLAEVRDTLSVTSRLHLRPETATTQKSAGGEQDALKWFESTALPAFCVAGKLDCATGTPNDLLAWAAIYLAPGKTPAIGIPSGNGIVYRQPARGLLLVCTHKECLDGNGQIQAISDHLVSIGAVDVPQLGVMARLPLVNKAFQNNSLEADFAATGTLTRVKYSSNARAEAQAAVFSESADSLLQFFEAKRGQDKANFEADTAELEAQTALVDQQLALEQALKNLEDFRSGVPVPETTDGADEEGGEEGTGAGSGE